MLLSPSSSLDKRHSSNLHFHSSFKGMLCLISLPCSELLCQAVRKHCGNIQSQTPVHTQSRGHYFCAFPSTRTSWACFEHDFLFVKDFGDPWLKKKNKTALPLQRGLHFPCGMLKETATWGTLTVAKLQRYQQETPSRKAADLNAVTTRLYHLPLCPDLFMSRPFSFFTRSIFPGANSNLKHLYSPPCKEILSWHSNHSKVV